MTTFNDFDLDPRIMEAIEKLGFETPTPIQVASIPILNEGNDVIGRARTGSGKTAAFGLPLIEKVKDGGKHVRALVLAPTRELAIQVSEAIQVFAKGIPINIVTIYGGSPYGPQLKALRKGVSIVVGTPGRVIDHMERGTLDLSNVEMLVLDEADEMLRMGFIEPVEHVLSSLPEERQIALFSATMPSAIQRIAKRFLVKPIILPVEDEGVEHIEQCYLRVPQRKKLAALTRILMGTARRTTLVFARTRVSCAQTADALMKIGIPADAIHGDLNQAARERVIAKLKSKALRVLVATDVAARGIDISHITHVVNFDLPGDTETYVHRIGRTARAGAKGAAITFVTPSEKRKLQQIERKLKVRMEEVFAPDNKDLSKLHREEIWTELKDNMKGNDDIREWLKELQEAEEVSAEDIAVAALSFLSNQRALPMEEVKPERERDRGKSRAERRSRPSNDDRGNLNEVEVFLSIGRKAGVQIGDIVGAITNEADIPGSKIGRISLNDSSSFVGVPRDVAEYLIKEHPTIIIRGNPTKLEMARGTGDGPRPRPRRDRRGDRPFNARKPKFKKDRKRKAGRRQGHK
jgi:ATP-dependent RNA helicase DeaD